jgi:hypothetical protein
MFTTINIGSSVRNGTLKQLKKIEKMSEQDELPKAEKGE